MTQLVVGLASVVGAGLVAGVGWLLRRVLTGKQDDAALVTHQALEAVQAIDVSLKAVQEERQTNQALIRDQAKRIIEQGRTLTEQAGRIAELEQEVHELQDEVAQLRAAS